MNTRKEVINLVEILGYPYAELVVDMFLTEIEISSISYVKETDKIILYRWYSSYEFQYDFDDLNEEDQKIVFLELSKYILN